MPVTMARRYLSQKINSEAIHYRGGDEDMLHHIHFREIVFILYICKTQQTMVHSFNNLQSTPE